MCNRTEETQDVITDKTFQYSPKPGNIRLLKDYPKITPWQMGHVLQALTELFQAFQVI